MSFILDALKKSESDRQRQNGPALFEVRVAPPRNSLPLWAIGLAVLLAVNLVIVAWVLLRRPASQDGAAEADTASHAVGQQFARAQNGSGGPLQRTQGSADANSGVQQGFGPANGGSGPGGPLGQPVGMTQPPGAGGMPQAGGAGQLGGAGQQGTGQGAYGQPGSGAGPVSGYGPQQGGPATAGGGYAQQGGANMNGGANGTGMAAANAAGGADAGGVNPDDYAPAADPPPMPGFANRVTRSTSSGVPLYQDVAQTNHLANLHLDLHVFAANPQQRFVMINTHKLREGDALPEGVHVESITPEGAILSQNGTRFLLPRE